MSTTPVNLTPEEVEAGLGAVLDWLESASNAAQLLHGFGFYDQSEWIQATADNLNKVIDDAINEVGAL